MKTRMIYLSVAVLALTLLAPAGWSQGLMAKVQGKCTDEAGKPIAGATVEFASLDNGQKYGYKTDKKGEYFSIAVPTGKYKISLIQDGKVIFFFNNVTVQLGQDEGVRVDFNLAKERQQATKANPQLSPEQRKQMEETQRRAVEAQKEVALVKGLNEKLNQANAAQAAGNWSEAISILDAATQVDPNRDLLWARLGEAQLGAGAAAKEKDDAAGHYQKASQAYLKAIQLKPNDGGYHNNLGQAYAKSGKPKEALAEYTQASQVDPSNASMYFFNGGAVLTNTATRETDPTTKAKDIDDANISFDKAIAAKPDYAEAWYQKGINLMSKATYDKSGKIVPAEGTVDAFNKYLELDPQGKHVQEAKGIIEGLGEKVTTSYRKAKSAPKK